MKKILLLLVLVSCTPQQAKTAEKLSVRIAEDVCKELTQDSSEPNWVTLACTALEVSELVRVVMPRQEWHAIKARRNAIDAGPGK